VYNLIYRVKDKIRYMVKKSSLSWHTFVYVIQYVYHDHKEWFFNEKKNYINM
jgi:hypothetical protein